MIKHIDYLRLEIPYFVDAIFNKTSNLNHVNSNIDSCAFGWAETNEALFSNSSSTFSENLIELRS